MIVGECITSLLFPFAWPHVYAPILPAALHHFLDAPVPFVMGLHADADSGSHAHRVGSEATLCYVDIDRQTIQMPEELPLFPHRADVMQELAAALDRFNVPHHSGNGENGGGGCGYDGALSANAQTYGTGGGGAGAPSILSARAYLHHRPAGDFDAMSASCTLPSGMQAARRKHSLHDMLDWDRQNGHHEGGGGPMPYANGNNHADRYPMPRGEAMQRIGGARTAVDAAADANADVMPQPAHVRTVPLSAHEQYCEDLRLNNTVREIFLNRFVQMFAAYKHFVVWPNQERQQWLSNRESLQNFDKASFLSDQQQHHRPFLSRFLESQMFATLVDNKIMSVWDGEFDANLRLFDNRIKILR